MIEKLKNNCERARWKVSLIFPDEDVWAIFASQAPLWLVEEKYQKYCKQKKSEKLLEILLDRLLLIERKRVDKAALKSLNTVSSAVKAKVFPALLVEDKSVVGIIITPSLIISGVVNRSCSSEQVEMFKKVNNVQLLTRQDVEELFPHLKEVRKIQKKLGLPVISGKYRIEDGVWDSDKNTFSQTTENVSMIGKK